MKFDVKVPAGSCEAPLPGCSCPVVSSHGGRQASELCGASFIRAPILLRRAPSSSPNYLPKPPPPNAITLGVRISTYELWGDTDIQSIATVIASINHNSVILQNSGTRWYHFIPV